MKTYVIIVAGGKGLRLGSEIPKQFLPIANQPILFHTIRKFKQALLNAELVLVLPESEIERWKSLSKSTEFEMLPIAKGGRTRFDSVKSGLTFVESDNSLVAIHDAVRPLVSGSTISNVLKAAAEKNSAIPVVDLKNSIRKVDKNNSHSLNRSEYKLVQTPQCFKAQIILKAYDQNYSEKFTDDASVVEALGHKITLVEGNSENIKITTKDDLVFAESILGSINN